MSTMSTDQSEEMSALRKRTAESLESAAESIRTAGDEGAGAIADFTDEAGEKLESGATYVRNFADGDVFGSLRQKIRRNPLGSLALAAGVGIVGGMMCRRSGRRADATCC